MGSEMCIRDSLGLHRHESEAARPAAELILDDIHFLDCSVRAEKVAQLLIGGIER